MTPSIVARAVLIGAFYYKKAHANMEASGVYQAARNLRKQGVPLNVALAVLVGQMDERPDSEREKIWGGHPLDFCA